MIDKKKYEKLLRRLDNIQKEINEIHQELLIEYEADELSPAERAEIEAIQKENEYKTLEEWKKEKPLD
jgi:hypothetical protein